MKYLSRIVTLGAACALSMNLWAVDPDITVEGIGLTLPNPIPVGVATLPDQAEVVVPEILVDGTTNYRVERIEDKAGYGKTQITSITLPNSVTSIGGNAFALLSNLTSITLPNALVTLGNNAFYMSGIENINLPSTLTAIPDACFQACTKLKSIKIPDGCKSLGSASFAMCSALNSVDFPAGLESIGMSAFMACTLITQMTCQAVTPPDFDTAGAPAAKWLAKINLYVPEESVDAYKAAPVWKGMNVKSLNDLPTGINDLNATNNSEVIYHNLSGQRVENPTKGEILVRTQDGKSAKVIM